MNDIIIFNHIPRTGGTTLRVILNRVYGESNVFFINSRDIPSSLEHYNSPGQDKKLRYKVISGHGALHFHPRQGNKFIITILRNPVSLFLSQYYYLRKSPDSNFLQDVSALDSIEEYIDYALKNGQDNMMVRCLDPENEQFTLKGAKPAQMNISGEAMLKRAKTSLHDHDMVIDLSRFDEGIFDLACMLDWKKIPLYRPLNKGVYPGPTSPANKTLIVRLEELLQADIELYRYYHEDIEAFRKKDHRGMRYRAFMTRQGIIKSLFA